MNKCILTVAALISAANAFCATVAVVAPQEGAAKSVTVGGKESAVVDAGKTAAIKATANAGWVFAGWYTAYDAETAEFSGEAVLDKAADWRSPSANFKAGDEDVTLYASFVIPAEDTLVFDLAETFAEATETTDDSDRPVLSLTNALDIAVSFDSLSFPTVTVKGLPSGLSFDKTSLRIYGKPKSPGVSKVEMSAKNASGYVFSQVFYVRVENSVAEHVEGFDSSDFTVGTEVDEYLDSYFYVDNTNAALKTVTLSGLPSGLSLVSEKEDGETYYYVRGVPKTEGDYTVICKATFSDGTSESASAIFTVAGADPFDYDVDFSGLEERFVGDSILAEDEVVIGTYDGEYKTGVTSVSGLPTGITAKKVDYGEGTLAYVLSGMFSKAGEFTVSVKVAYYDWDAEKIATTTLSKKVVVGDAVGSYVSAGLLGDELESAKCKVSGSGVYAAGSTAKLTATAGSGYVFAGWCDAAGLPMTFGAQDYRKSPLNIQVAPGAELEWYASFILKDDDYIDIDASDIEDEGIEIDTASYEKVESSFIVESGSLPTLKLANLPSGVVCEPSALIAGEYVVSYDPAAASKKPFPGRYAVTVTGTNASRMSDEATFTVTVLNYTDDDIEVEDDYGVLTPNVAMEPISLANAVDFARGDTLAVSGLPAGLKYDDKSALRAISGTPTKPGDYTITFTAKIAGETPRTAVATAFIKVKDFPTVAAVVSDGALAAGNKVAGTGSFKSGSKTTLKATAAKGWVFAGWGEGSGLDGLAALNPSIAYVVGTNDLVEIEASFIEVRDDDLFIDDPGVVTVVKNVAFTTNLVETLTTTRSRPTVLVSGLPSGLKFDAKTFLIAGTVGSSAKSGYYYATISAKNAGGYTFTRVVKFVVLDAPDAEIPDEPELANDANIDFSPIDGLSTGDYCPADGVDAVALYVDPKEDGTEVSAVSVSGVPSGLKASVLVEEGEAEIVLFGTPNKPGRCTLKVQVTYADRSKATSEYAFTVQDGGSAWLDVESCDASMGTVSGAGVYASGATVKLGAKPASGNVFAGWFEEEDVPFDVVATTDGVDCRTAAAAFIFRKEMFSNLDPVLYGCFIAKADDAIAVSGLDEGWEIDPALDGELAFAVESASLPKLTASGLPKGVTLDAVQGRFVYSAASQAQIVPGYYTVTVKAVNQSNASATAKLAVFVANKTTDAIGGLDPSADAYPLYAGVELDPELILPEVDSADGWKLAAAGLPSGLKLAQDKETGAYSVIGVATKAGTNTVTFTATKGREKEVATITVGVAALPEWAYGTYDGAYFEFDGEVTNAVGQVTATVSSAGKVSGKIQKGGKSYSFSAASFGGYDPDDGVFTAHVTVPWSRTDSEEFLLTVGASESGLGSVTLEPVGDGAHYAEAVQNAWLRKDVALPAFASGAKQPVLVLAKAACCGMESYDLVCKFGAKGVVTVSGTVNGVAATSKPQLLAAVWDGEMLVGSFVVYVANAKLDNGAYCHVFDVVLSDTDEDGKLDFAAVPEG